MQEKSNQSSYKGAMMDGATIFKNIWDATSAAIEADLKERGETFLPGNPDFDALTDIIEENRRDREALSRVMDSPVQGWISPGL